MTTEKVSYTAFSWAALQSVNFPVLNVDGYGKLLHLKPENQRNCRELQKNHQVKYEG